LGLARLRALVAGEVDGIAHDNADHCKATREPGQGAQIVAGDAGRVASPLKRQHRLGGEAQLVGDGDADAAVADVQAEKAWLTLQRELPPLILSPPGK